MKCTNFFRLRYLPIMAVIALSAIVLSTPLVWAGNDDEEIPLDVVDIFFELNNTDGDLGIHALIDGEPWKKLIIEDPDGRRILTVSNSGRLAQQGLTELFFESAEPSFDELEPEEFFERFPEGIYEVEGVTLEKEELDGEAFISHIMPAPPENVQISGEDAAEDCDSELPAVTSPVVISWDPVTTFHPELGDEGPVDITGYILVVEREEPFSLVFSMDLPPTITEFQVPDELIDLGDEFKFEILVREATGNKTAIESCFEIGE